MTPFDQRLGIRADIKRHLEFIYPDHDADDLANKFVEAFYPSVLERPVKPASLWDEHDTVLITYGDSILDEGQKPLAVLQDFLEKNLYGDISAVHILPFFPYTSDDGFAVQDYREVRPDLGDWDNVSAIASGYRLMADVVINHCSASHQWFQELCAGQKPGKDYFKTASPSDDLDSVVRPRPFDLLRPTPTPNGVRQVWCTFSHDQVDLDFSNPDVLIEFVRIMRHYIENGVRIFRLDAIAFIWKVVGTACVHLPQTHEVVRLLRRLCDGRDETVLLITETNVPNYENLQYFGNGNEAHLIYNFSLPPLLLHALLTGRSEYLRRWISSMPTPPRGCTYFNFTASHDGIGLRPAEGLLPQEDFDVMLDAVETFGGRVTMRSVGEGKQKAYEMNCTYFDALKGTISGVDDCQEERFIAAQTVMMALQGIPAFYIHSLLATPNDYDKVEKTEHNRAINRHQWQRDELDQALRTDTPHARVFNELRRRIAIRRKQPAFHPDAAQVILQPQTGLFGFQRHSETQTLYMIVNLMNEEKPLSLFDLALDHDHDWWELLSGEAITSPKGEMTLAPYQCVWIAGYDQVSS